MTSERIDSNDSNRFSKFPRFEIELRRSVCLLRAREIIGDCFAAKTARFRESGEAMESQTQGKTQRPAENLKSRVSFRHVSSVRFHGSRLSVVPMSLRLRACARDATAEWLTSKTTPPRRVPSGRRASPPPPGAASAAPPRARCARHQSTKNLPSLFPHFLREIPIASVGDDALVTRATLTIPPLLSPRYARSRRTSISSTSSPRAAPPRPRPPRSTLPTTPRIPASKGPTRPRTPPPDPLRAARRRRARARPPPTPRLPRAGAMRTPPRPRPSSRRRRRRPRRRRRRRPPRARPRRSRFDSARPTTSSCASPAMRARAPSGATPRDRPDRRAACLVVDFRDRAAPRASTRRAPRLESPLTTISLSPFSRSRAIMHRRGFRLPIAQVQGSVQLGALHPRGRAGNARDASQRDPGVRLGHVRLPPGTSHVRSSRASRPDATCFFFRCFSRTARPLVVASVCQLENVETGSGTRSSGASARGRGSARSIALDRSRARHPDGPDSRISAFSHARGAPRSTARRR